MAALRRWFSSRSALARLPVWSALALAAAGILFFPIPAQAEPPADRFFRVEARRFEYLPAVIRVSPGDRVTIEFAPMDVAHGFSLDGYGVGASAEPGQPARITFLADKTGVFRFRCTVICGSLHPFMIGTLTVGGDYLWARAAALAALAAAAALWMKRA